MFLILEILLHVSVIHSMHDYQSCTTMPSKPKNVSRNVITSQNAQTNGKMVKFKFHNKRVKCPLAKMFPFEAILVSYSIQIMTLSYQNHNFTLTVKGMIYEC